MRKIIKKIPYFGLLAVKIYRKFNGGVEFISSKNYWQKRYEGGGNSGDGSYNHLAKFKANIINNFLKEKKIISTLELGCGDGNQLKYLNYKNYKGLDVSSSAVEICKKLFQEDESKSFDLLKNYPDSKYDLVVSLDVIYHLVEDEVFDSHLKNIFKSSNKHVIIYSSNFEDKYIGIVEHVRHRNFTKWIEKNIMDFKLVNKVSNKFKYDGDGTNTSLADFYFYEKK